MNRWLISYDISSNRTRGRIFRFLKKRSTHIQKSLFFYIGTQNDLQKIENFIISCIDNTDSIFFMPCCDKCYYQSKLYSPATPILMVS